MNIDNARLAALRTGFQTHFQSGYDAMGTKSMWKQVASFVKSNDKTETYGWLADLLRMRKWIGPRQIKSMVAQAAVIANEPFELTVGVNRYDILFDKLSTYEPRFKMMGQAAATNADLLVFAMLKAGFTTNCWDGQFFFDTDHPLLKDDGATTTFANTDGGSGAPWFLIDSSKGFLPMIYQQAIPPQFVSKDKATDDNVFDNNTFVYGADSYEAAGYGIPQLCWGSKQALTAANYAAARAAMGSYVSGGGKPLGIVPDTLVVSPTLESAGNKIVNTENATGGESNEWKGTAKLVVCPWLA